LPDHLVRDAVADEVLAEVLDARELTELRGRGAL
jgi:hypothetical protein